MKKHLRLVNALMRGVWMMEPDAAQKALPLAQDFLTGRMGAISDDEGPMQISVISPEGSTMTMDWAGASLKDEEIQKGSTVVIPVSGPVMKEDFCGDAGSMTKARFIQEADQHENVDLILLDIDSPGGMIDGTQTLVEAIQNTTTRTVAYVEEGMAASAAYWIASAADEIYVSRPTDQVGSIGVYVGLRVTKKQIEEGDIPVQIYAPESEEKNGDIRAVLEGNTKPIEAGLSKLAQTFIASVKENRAGRLDLSQGDPFKGKLYYADEAIKIGLIDGIKSRAELISQEQTAILERQLEESRKTNSTYIMKQFARVNAAIGVETLESSEEGAYLQETQIEALEQELASKTTAVEEAEAAQKAAEEKVTAAQAEATAAADILAEVATSMGLEAEGSAEELKASISAKVASLMDLPGAKPAGSKPPKAVEGEEEEEAEAFEMRGGIYDELRQSIFDDPNA